MKRFIAVILAIIYMSTAMGATVHLHYCMGKLTEWRLGDSKDDLCDSCGMKKAKAGEQLSKKNCCKDEFKELKLKKDQRVPENSQPVAFAPLAATPVAVYTLPVVPVTSLAVVFPVAKAPPGITGAPVFLLNCNFRI